MAKATGTHENSIKAIFVFSKVAKLRRDIWDRREWKSLANQHRGYSERDRKRATVAENSDDWRKPPGFGAIHRIFMLETSPKGDKVFFVVECLSAPASGIVSAQSFPQTPNVPQKNRQSLLTPSR